MNDFAGSLAGYRAGKESSDGDKRDCECHGVTLLPCRCFADRRETLRRGLDSVSGGHAFRNSSATPEDFRACYTYRYVSLRMTTVGDI
jgi:hypothetical protein